MGIIKALTTKVLRPACDPAQFDFTTTAEIELLAESVGQERALEALSFGVEIERKGYNLYAIGPPGIGKRTFIQNYLQQVAKDQPAPTDWCYVNNFSEPNKPIALELPSGSGEKLREDMESLIDQLRFSIPAIFESKEYQSRIYQINQEYKKREDETIKILQQEAEKENMTILRTPNGFTIVPTKEGEVMSPQEIEKLSDEEKDEREKRATKLRERLTKILNNMPKWYKEKHKKEKEVEKEYCATVVISLVEEIKKKYEDLPKVINYLTDVQQDIIDNPKDFSKKEEGFTVAFGLAILEKPSFTRYRVNVLIGNNKANGAPIIFEVNPNYSNLVGKLEHKAQLGTLVTDFTLIKPGALHKANGGYLVLDVLKVLISPYAWDALKRILSTKEIKIEPLGQMLGITGATPLEPAPIPINIKIILLGNRFLYHLLGSLDEEFKKLFKVAVDFEDRIERTSELTQQYAQLIAKLVHDEQLFAFHRNAVAHVIDHCVRLAGDTERLSLHMQSLVEILCEANHWAVKSGNEIVQEEDVQKAIDARIRRVDQIRQRLYEEIDSGSILIESKGQAVGQVNAISVIVLSDFMFGHPSKITAIARLGDAEVIDIEREIELGGPIHSKGVLILSGFIKGRYAKNRQLSLSASLVFEQTYGMIEGDSASVAELCALLSSLAELPIKQSLAVTGSVNQHGQVQAVGAVNEKIEGFFDICKTKGLTGDQGVLIPAANVRHLMLRQDVVDAVSKKQFSVYPIQTIDEAIEMLTGIPAGARDKKGNYPEKSVNYFCENALQKFADLRRLEHRDE